MLFLRPFSKHCLSAINGSFFIDEAAGQPGWGENTFAVDIARSIFPFSSSMWDCLNLLQGIKLDPYNIALFQGPRRE